MKRFSCQAFELLVTPSDDTLYQSSQDWHEGQHNLLPWWEYFLGVMVLSAYREFETRVGVVTSARGTVRSRH